MVWAGFFSHDTVRIQMTKVKMIGATYQEILEESVVIHQDDEDKTWVDIPAVVSVRGRK